MKQKNEYHLVTVYLKNNENEFCFYERHYKNENELEFCFAKIFYKEHLVLIINYEEGERLVIPGDNISRVFIHPKQRLDNPKQKILATTKVMYAYDPREEWTETTTI